MALSRIEMRRVPDGLREWNKFFNEVVVTPDDGTVTTVTIENNSVTLAKLDDLSVVTVTTTPYTIDEEQVILVDDDTIGGAATVNLPPAADVTKTTINIKKIGSTANVTIDADGTETIDGGLTADLTVQFECITLMSDGSNWFIL